VIRVINRLKVIHLSQLLLFCDLNEESDETNLKFIGCLHDHDFSTHKKPKIT